MDPSRELRGDCAACQGLCCVGLAFDRSEWFGFDKRADVACRHLEAENRCKIHDHLEAFGQAGCARYDCYGAGQRITLELYAGAAWRDDAQLAREVLDAFRKLCDVHELRLLLHEAGRLPLSAEQAERRARLLAELGRSLSPHTLRAMNVPALAEAVHELLRGLRDCASPLLRRKRRLPLQQ